jgi:hypothetical protein
MNPNPLEVRVVLVSIEREKMTTQRWKAQSEPEQRRT